MVKVSRSFGNGAMAFFFFFFTEGAAVSVSDVHHLVEGGCAPSCTAAVRPGPPQIPSRSRSLGENSNGGDAAAIHVNPSRRCRASLRSPPPLVPSARPGTSPVDGEIVMDRVCSCCALLRSAATYLQPRRSCRPSAASDPLAGK